MLILTKINHSLSREFEKVLTFFKVILSGQIMEVLVGREVDFDDGNETAAVTAAAMAVIPKKKKKKRYKRKRLCFYGVVLVRFFFSQKDQVQQYWLCDVF